MNLQITPETELRKITFIATETRGMFPQEHGKSSNNENRDGGVKFSGRNYFSRLIWAYVVQNETSLDW